MQPRVSTGLRVTLLFLILGAGVMASGCISYAVTGVGAGPGTRYNDDGAVECSEPATINVRGNTQIDTVEMTVFAHDCAPPVFDGDGAYCLPTDCFTYSYWWTEAECGEKVTGDIACIHEGTAGPDGRLLVHEVTFKVTREFHFEIREILGAGASRVLYEMDAELSRG